jgi:hypothetical protein
MLSCAFRLVRSHRSLVQGILKEATPTALLSAPHAGGQLICAAGNKSEDGHGGEDS